MLYRYLASLFLKGSLPNRAEKFTVDLATARTNSSLGKAGVTITVMDKGNGTWTLTLKFEDDSTIEFTNDELSNGTKITLEFTDILFTNTAQAGATDPKFYRGWRVTPGE